jgi:hypothetical protein
LAAVLQEGPAVPLRFHLVFDWAIMSRTLIIPGWLLTIVAALFFGGCSYFSPSDAEVLRALTANDPLSGQVYRIENLHRTNGYEQSGKYVVDFTGELHFIADAAGFLGQGAKQGDDPLGALAALGMAASGVAKWGLVNSLMLSARKKGDVVPFSGSIVMMKTERGWLADPASEVQIGIGAGTSRPADPAATREGSGSPR